MQYICCSITLTAFLCAAIHSSSDPAVLTHFNISPYIYAISTDDLQFAKCFNLYAKLFMRNSCLMENIRPYVFICENKQKLINDGCKLDIDLCVFILLRWMFIYN